MRLLSTDFMMMTAGAVTIVPLILFTLGAARAQLSTAGLQHFIAFAPTLLLAVTLCDEPLTLAHAASLSLTWVALGDYILDLRHRLHRLARLSWAPLRVPTGHLDKNRDSVT